jgi:hypothetical protein
LHQEVSRQEASVTHRGVALRVAPVDTAMIVDNPDHGFDVVGCRQP